MVEAKLVADIVLLVVIRDNSEVLLELLVSEFVFLFGSVGFSVF
jgi:hypothetical protein